MFDRLVGGAVFTEADAVVREHMHDAQFHQGRHAQRIAAVVAEGQEGATIGNEAAVQGDAVHDRGHAEFAHAVVDVPSAHGCAIGVDGLHHLTRGTDAHARRGLGVGEVGAGEVGRAAQHLGQRGGQRFERQLRSLARGHGLCLGVCAQHHVHHGLREGLGQVALHAARQLACLDGIRSLVGGHAGIPGFFGFCTRGPGVPGGGDVFRDDEGRGVPAERRAGQLDLFGTQRLAVRFGRVRAVGAALPDTGLADDECGSLERLLGIKQCLAHHGSVMPVDRADHVPAVGHKTQGGVVGEPGRHLAIDGNAVVVVQRHQLVEPPGAGQGRRLVADALHHAAVSHEDIGAVVDDGVAFAVELARQKFFGQCKTDGVRQALPERAGGGFHASCQTVLGVAGCLAVQLAEVLELRHRQCVSGQVQQGVQQHRRMAIGQHEAVAVEPVRVARIVFQMATRHAFGRTWAPQGHGHVGHAHGRAGVPGVGLLHGVHRECSDGVGHGLGSGHGWFGSGNGRGPWVGCGADFIARPVGDLWKPGNRAGARA